MVRPWPLLFLLLLPLLISATPLLVRTREMRLVAAALLIVFCILGVSLGGPLYFPAAAAMVAAACMSEP